MRADGSVEDKRGIWSWAVEPKLSKLTTSLMLACVFKGFVWGILPGDVAFSTYQLPCRVTVYVICKSSTSKKNPCVSGDRIHKFHEEKKLMKRWRKDKLWFYIYKMKTFAKKQGFMINWDLPLSYPSLCDCVCILLPSDLPGIAGQMHSCTYVMSDRHTRGKRGRKLEHEIKDNCLLMSFLSDWTFAYDRVHVPVF